jgi:hypothetical protein
MDLEDCPEQTGGPSKSPPNAGAEGVDPEKEDDKVVKKRTKTGCQTCRSRRIKCDEGKPECHNCIKSKRQCGGCPRAARADLRLWLEKWGARWIRR